jgi:hypothetical protein
LAKKRSSTKRKARTERVSNTSAPKLSYRARARSFGSRVKKDANWLEMLLFGAAGYLSGNLLNDLGISEAIYGKMSYSNPLKQQIDFAYSNSGGKLQGGNTIMKDVGIVGLAKSGYDAYKGKMGKGDLNAVLPFSIGAILDPAKDKGSPSGAKHGGRW